MASIIEESYNNDINNNNNNNNNNNDNNIDHHYYAQEDSLISINNNDSSDSNNKPWGELADFIQPTDVIRKHAPEISQFYSDQNAVIEKLIAIDSHSSQSESENEENKLTQENRKIISEKKASFALKLSFYMTFFLLGLKIVAGVHSSSMAILSIAVDSLLDLLSQGTLLITTQSAKKKDPHRYPGGKAKFQSLGITIFACIMSMAGLQLFIESFRSLIEGFNNSGSIDIVTMDAITLSTIGLNVFIQTTEYFYCRLIMKSLMAEHSGAVDAIAADHLNDVFINVIGVIPAIIAGNSNKAWFLDPIGGMLLSIYIMFRWAKACKEQIGVLVGASAPKEFLTQLTYLASIHCPEKIKKVDFVSAYHYGTRFLVEVHIVLDADMPLRESHDIGESLEKKIEALEDVEIAFVHLDYEWMHTPEHGRPK